MDYLSLKDGQIHCEDVALNTIANDIGTPVYVYSKATLVRHCQNFLKAFADYPTLACFAVKANSNIAYLKQIFLQGLGADVVSGGELWRALKAGLDPQKIVYSGVGKSDAEIALALESKVLSFNVESFFELERISAISAQTGQQASLCLRVNPDIDAKTHPKIATGMYQSKFGIAEVDLDGFLSFIRPRKHIRLLGLACHIGSQILEVEPFAKATERLVSLATKLQKDGFPLTHINIGGGVGIRYRNETPISLENYAATAIKLIRPTGLKLVVEPGRVIAGNTGALLTKVMGIKKTPLKKFIVVDAAMNDLIRPAFYDAYHDIQLVDQSSSAKNATLEEFDVVGPICESSDFLGVGRQLAAPRSGDLLYIRSSGAYAASMASNYNTRTRSPEVLVDQSKYSLIRRREKLDDLWRDEIY